MDPPFVSRVKVIIALVSCGLLYAEYRWGQRVSRRVKKTIAALLALSAVAAYFQFAHYPLEGYHRWELFHYYVGAKYAPELGYSRLYDCAAVAEAELGDGDGVRRRTLRDLATNVVVPAAGALDRPEACKQRFDSQRWLGFVADIDWFRHASGPRKWRGMQNDHGYNPSPVWTVAGRAIASLSAPSDRFFRAVAALDNLLMVAIIAMLGWAFGWRAAAVGTVFWGLQAPSVFGWTGGAFLRQDWLFCTVISAALMRRRYYLLAGFALGYAALLRLFPAVLWTGPLVLVAPYLLKRQRIPSRYRRLFAGGLISACLLVPASLVVAGPQAYGEFIARIGTHSSTPIANHMSLRTVLSASSEGSLERKLDRALVDPVEPWKQARRERLRQLRWLHWASVAAFMVMLIATLRRLRTPWLAMALSLAAVPILTDPSCYYYSMWVLAAVLCRARRSLEIALVATAGIGQVVVREFGAFDERYVALAALYVALSVLVVLLFARLPGKNRAAA